jgi:crossover junction endodeoxyribonuclease RuvC
VTPDQSVKIVGLDLSLASTGVAVADELGVLQVGQVRTKPTGDGLIARRVRLRRIRTELRPWLVAADLVVIEGLAYASRSPHATERAGLWWLVVDQLLAEHVPVAVVSPTARAKYATGKGNAGKDQVLAAVVRRYPDVDVTGNDQADALVLAAMGARSLGCPIEAGGITGLPKTHLDAMTKVAWTDTEGTAA